MSDTPLVCKVPECGRPVRTRGLCQTHRNHLRKFGQVREIRRIRPRQKNPAPLVCTVPGCGRPVRARGMCQTHYKQDRKFGEVREIKRHRPRRRGAAKLGGLSLSREAAVMVTEVAKSRGVTPNHQLTDILEEWAQKVERATKRRGRAKKGE